MSEGIEPALSAEEWAAEWDMKLPRYLFEADRAWIAARALHGRISWEMVDALRAERAKVATGDPPHPNDPAYHWWVEAGERLRIFTALADLLESLLPPR